MKFVGLDLGGVNSQACFREHSGSETIKDSAYPERPSCVLLPLVRKEKIIAGDEALRNDRGCGMVWPPLSMAAKNGWSRDIPPIGAGRLLLATIWQKLVASGHWNEPQWAPPDDLPTINIASPTECLTAEVVALLNQIPEKANSIQAVLAIPNQLPEESQESLLGQLPVGARLIWRSVAAAMAWSEARPSLIKENTQLAVLDAGFYGVEISVFEFRRKEKDGKTFLLPVRRISRLGYIKTKPLFADSPSSFTHLHLDLSGLEQHLGEISSAIGVLAELLICGPMADSLSFILKARFPDKKWPASERNIVARGACLFAWRLAREWPTYLDILPSLELFTFTEEHDPKWLPLIPPDSEVEGGYEFQQSIPRQIYIEKGTPRLASWLQRSGESEYRKLSTDLPTQTIRNAWVDLNISARSAGGFARVRITPSASESDVFSSGGLMLNWQSMERIARKPNQRWPIELKYGFPACGKLYAHKPFFDSFLFNSDLHLANALEHDRQEHRMVALGILKSSAAATISTSQAGVTSAGGDAAPVNLLVCFSTGTPDVPCEFMGGGWAGRSQIYVPLSNKSDHAKKIAERLWRRLKDLLQDKRALSAEINALIYILGRMAGYSPEAFQNRLAKEIYPVTSSGRLFAAGRVLQTPEHGRLIFEAVMDKFEYSQPLNNNWLRMLVYILYQRPEVLKGVPRLQVVAAMKLCLDLFEQQVRLRNARVLFTNSLRALALLLRVRRHAQARDFLVLHKCSDDEERLAQRLASLLQQAKGLRLRSGPSLLIDRVAEWLKVEASTDEMPPIAPPDEEEDDD